MCLKCQNPPNIFFIKESKPPSEMDAKWVTRWYITEIRLPALKIPQRQYFGGDTNTELHATLDIYFALHSYGNIPIFTNLSE